MRRIVSEGGLILRRMKTGVEKSTGSQGLAKVRAWLYSYSVQLLCCQCGTT